MQLLVLDNYDSFTWNLVQYLGELGAEAEVVRNDVATPEQLLGRGAAGVVISPGPGDPGAAGISIALVQACAAQRRPLLGVCLGHQAIGAAFGARIVRARRIMHGKVSEIAHDARGLFKGVASPFSATRYHSLVIDEGTLPAELEISARSGDHEIMGVRHRELPIEGLQFHPESILTAVGKDLLRNFLVLCRESRA